MAGNQDDRSSRTAAAEARKRKVLARGKDRLDRIVMGTSYTPPEAHEEVSIMGEGSGGLSTVHPPSTAVPTAETAKVSVPSPPQTSEPAPRPPSASVLQQARSTAAPASLANPSLEEVGTRSKGAQHPATTVTTVAQRHTDYSQVLIGAVKQTLRLRLILAVVLAYCEHCYPLRDKAGTAIVEHSSFNVILDAARNLEPLVLLISLQLFVVLMGFADLFFRPRTTALRAAALEAQSSYVWKIVGTVLPLLTNRMKAISVLLQATSSVMDVVAVFLVFLGVLLSSPNDMCLPVSI